MATTPATAHFSDTVVLRARLFHQRGYNTSEIRMHLLDEGHDVPLATVQNWITNTTRITAGWPARKRLATATA